MPVFRDFSENGQLLQTKDEILSEDNLERYLKDYGQDRAKGYMDALNDIVAHLENCYHKEKKESSGKITILPRSDNDLRKHILALRNESVELSNAIKLSLT